MKIALTLALALATSVTAYADSLVTVRPVGSDSVSWSQLGPVFGTIPQHFSFTTADGVTGSGALAGGVGQVVLQGLGWDGNFTPGDYLLWTNNRGPLTLSFDQGYTEIGAQIEASFYGAFTARICTNAGCFSETGNSNSGANGSAIYIGYQSATPFTFITFSLTSAVSQPADFAINSLTMTSPVAVTPEPSSLALLATGMLGAAGMMRRRFVRSSS